MAEKMKKYTGFKDESSRPEIKKRVRSIAQKEASKSHDMDKKSSGRDSGATRQRYQIASGKIKDQATNLGKSKKCY